MALLQGQGGLSTRRGLNGQQQGIGGINPNLALLLMGSGKMQIHRNLDGSIQMPGQQQAPQTMSAWRMQSPSTPTPAPQPQAPAMSGRPVDPFEPKNPSGIQQEGFAKFFNAPNNAPQSQQMPAQGGFQKLQGEPSFVSGATKQPQSTQASEWDSIINRAKAEVASPAYQQRQQDRSVAPFMQGAMAPQQQFSSPGTAIPAQTKAPHWGEIKQPDPRTVRWAEQMRQNVNNATFTPDNVATAFMGIPAPQTPNIPLLSNHQRGIINGIAPPQIPQPPQALNTRLEVTNPQGGPWVDSNPYMGMNQQFPAQAPQQAPQIPINPLQVQMNRNYQSADMLKAFGGTSPSPVGVESNLRGALDNFQQPISIQSVPQPPPIDPALQSALTMFQAPQQQPFDFNALLQGALNQNPNTRKPNLPFNLGAWLLQMRKGMQQTNQLPQGAGAVSDLFPQPGQY